MKSLKLFSRKRDKHSIYKRKSSKYWKNSRLAKHPLFGSLLSRNLFS